MSRRRYLIAYDISDPKRLRRVIKVMEAYGQRLQYSVFLCDLSGMEFTRWNRDVLEVVHLGEDSVVTIDLGSVEAAAEVRTLGRPRTLPSTGPTIV
ncbi:CRISPR-associated endonuclease Cas2 [Phytoactinopolyspora limicola]|uniref:CRISPR-associated endonuclease Cas2 n=1 Tax=Phytoactinopolyspora limicola TaxID=2715536 RepID=UPI001407E770|nr:CRISPR-associated endonuclease Cas2 [Phytoactinopolyspora limicola]